MTAAECFEFVMGGFYRDPVPEIALRALEFALENEFFQGEQSGNLHLSFLRLAEVYPAVRELYESLRVALDGMNYKIVTLILEPPAEFRDGAFLVNEPQNPQDLDNCWCEFLMTGNTDVVHRIVSVLDRDDLLRSLLMESLAAGDAGRFPLSESDRGMLAVMGIVIVPANEFPDVETPFLILPGDVDLLFWQGLRAGAEVCKQILQQMEPEEMYYVATRGAALWSLKANANQHAVIRDLCDAEAMKPGGRGRVYLSDD